MALVLRVYNCMNRPLGSKATPAPIPLGSPAQEAAQQIAQLYERYQGMVLRTAYLILGRWDQAEDVGQEVWMIALRSLETYEEQRGAWSTWLHQITVSRCLRVRRRLSSWLRRELPLPELGGPLSPLPTPLETVLGQEQQQRIWTAVQRLSLKLRVVIILRYYQDLSYEAIADVLDCPVGTVRSRLHAARSSLRDMLEEQL
jgi:RNA polymerase sigma-70 factor, ECF subfamily